MFGIKVSRIKQLNTQPHPGMHLTSNIYCSTLDANLKLIINGRITKLDILSWFVGFNHNYMPLYVQFLIYIVTIYDLSSIFKYIWKNLFRFTDWTDDLIIVDNDRLDNGKWIIELPWIREYLQKESVIIVIIHIINI